MYKRIKDAKPQMPAKSLIVIRINEVFECTPGKVAGNKISDWAKIMAMTPDWSTFKGRYVLWPPYILLPTILRAYCTGIFLCA